MGGKTICEGGIPTEAINLKAKGGTNRSIKEEAVFHAARQNDSPIPSISNQSAAVSMYAHSRSSREKL
jgi:hypothetical protein